MLVQLDAHQVSTLLALLEAERPLSAHRLGERLGISARALRYRLPLVQAWLAHHGVELVVKPRQGLFIKASSDLRQRLRAELQQRQQPPVLRAEERHPYLLFLLLVRPRGLTVEALQANLGISRATLLRDLRQLEAQLSPKGLILRRLRQQGLRILGTEVTQRHLAIEILLRHEMNEVLTELSLRGKVEAYPLTTLQTLLLEDVKTWNLPSARRWITRVERDLNLNLSDDDLLFLSLYWALALQRMHAGLVVGRLERPVEVVISAQEFARVEALSPLSGNGTPLPRDEIFQLLVEIKACQGQLTLAAFPTPLENTDLCQLIAEQMLNHVGERLGYDLCRADILSQMALHLSRALARLRAGLPLHNPLTQDISQAYPHLWQPSLEVAQQVGAKFGLSIPEAEVAYLVMYLALAVQLAEQTRKPRYRVVVACPTGGVMARLLVYRLQNAFPEVEIVATVSLRQLPRLDPAQVDLVIATVKQTAGRLPVLTVNPLLGEEDIQRIKTYLKSLHPRYDSTTQKGA